MDELADRLDQAADALTAVAREVPALTVDPAAFGALPAALVAGAPAGPGLPGRIGRSLHDHFVAVLDARAHEAATVATRLTGMAASVRTTRQSYAETDEAVGRRFTREM